MLLTRRIFARAWSVDSNRHKTGAPPANIRFQAMEHNLSSHAQFSSEQATLELGGGIRALPKLPTRALLLSKSSIGTPTHLVWWAREDMPTLSICIADQYKKESVRPLGSGEIITLAISQTPCPQSTLPVDPWFRHISKAESASRPNDLFWWLITT
jgi:hypothetical protein